MTEPTHVTPEELLGAAPSRPAGWLALYYERPIELVRGKGATVWDSEGNEYLDLFGGIVTTISGHAVDQLVDALKDQADRIAHTSTLYLIEPMVRLAERLVELAPVREAGEGVLRRVGDRGRRGGPADGDERAQEQPGDRTAQLVPRSQLRCGRGDGNRAWGATSLSPLRVSYALAPVLLPLPVEARVPELRVACADDVRSLIETTTAGDVAAMIAEPIQGVGGFITPPKEYFTKVKAILDEYSIPLILDEVQTGFGRTGEAFWGAERLRRDAGPRHVREGARQRDGHRRGRSAVPTSSTRSRPTRSPRSAATRSRPPSRSRTSTTSKRRGSRPTPSASASSCSRGSTTWARATSSSATSAARD